MEYLAAVAGAAVLLYFLGKRAGKGGGDQADERESPAGDEFRHLLRLRERVAA